MANVRFAAAGFQLGVGLVLLSSAASQMIPGPARQAGLQDPPVAAAGWVQEALDGLVHEHGCGQRVACVMPGGVPGAVLVEQAADAELLVLGSEPGAGPGSTGSYCIRFACCPVVFVPA